MSALPPEDRWERVDRLFREALDIPPAEREAWLARARASDPDAAEEVDALLRTEPTGRDFLEESVEDVFDTGSLRSPPPGPTKRHPEPTRAGPYRLVRKVGRGGTASVYLAERDDGQWTQRVAVKILHRGLDTERVVARFRDERQILSSLDHPNIARFLGGGSTEDGRPFLVMEYVDGTPIVDYCDDHGLGLDRRLRLFLDVAAALQAAHQRLVVHRDVKPSNVLVDVEGRVKLLDFGIAKILEPSWDGTTTRIGNRILTPSYASPEQVRGNAITTASDVYQMGILLCELLSGRRPYEVKALSPASAERAIAEAEPARPSALASEDAATHRGLSVDGLRRRLRGDLDTIVLKALHKPPEERYATAAAMAEDVGRHLDGFPVAARPDGVGYRIRKFVRRHRLGVALGAAAVVALGSASFFFRLQARQAEAERDRAQVAQQRAERVTDFVTRLLQVADPDVVGGDAVAGLPMLDTGVELARAQLGDDPAALADVLGTIGDLYSTLGKGDRADSVLSEALALRRAGVEDPEGLVDDLNRLAFVRGWFQRRTENAEALYLEAIRVAEASLVPRSPRLATALIGLADLPLGPEGDITGPDRRRALADSALAILREHPVEEVAEALATALYVSATVPSAGDRTLPELREALALRRAVFGEDNIGIAVILNDMALYLETRDPVAADTLMARAAELHARLLGEENQTTLTILNNRAGLLRDQERYLDAEPLYREVLAIRREFFPAEKTSIAYTLHGLGWVLAETGRAAEAEGHLKEMLRILEEAGDDLTTPRLQVGRSTLGRAVALQGRYAEAEPLLRESWDWFNRTYPGSPLVVTLRDRLVDLYVATGRPDEAGRIEATANSTGA